MAQQLPPREAQLAKLDRYIADKNKPADRRARYRRQRAALVKEMRAERDALDVVLAGEEG